MIPVAAVIIARKGSYRLPGKNMRLFHGRPLVAHKVWQLKQCATVTEVFVGADCDEILDAARGEGAVCFSREPEFCDEKSRTWNEVIYDMLGKFQSDVVVWAHCTNPCIPPARYDEAVRRLTHTRHDSIVGVTPVKNHFWWHNKPLNFDPYHRAHVPAARLMPIMGQNGGLFVATWQAMRTWSYVYGPDPELMVIPEEEAVDIDTLEDYHRALGCYRP